MELRQLRYTLAVVDHGTFTAAAAECFVAQPSLSHAVATLERELGVELFHRVGRRVRLTSAGEAFVPAAREALRAIDTVRAEVDAVAGVVAGHLDLVALPTLAVDPVAPLVGAFRLQHPSVAVRLAHPDGSDQLIQLVESGDSELGVTELPVTSQRIVTHPLQRQELVAVLPPGSSPPRSGCLDLVTLARQPLVTQPVGTSTRDAIDTALRSVGATALLAVETDQREAIVPLVLAGAGTAVLPRSMAQHAHGAVIAALHPPIWRDIGIIHRNAMLSPAARAFLAATLATRA